MFSSCFWKTSPFPFSPDLFRSGPGVGRGPPDRGGQPGRGDAPGASLRRDEAPPAAHRHRAGAATALCGKEPTTGPVMQESARGEDYGCAADYVDSFIICYVYLFANGGLAQNVSTIMNM